MSAIPRKGVKRNVGKISVERPTKTPRINGEEEALAQDEVPGQGQGPPVSSSYAKIETYEIPRAKISMNFEGEVGHILKESFIKSIQSCPTDLDLICSDGVAFAHRFILMGVSEFFFRLLHDRDTKDTEAITLVNVSITHLLLALELIYSGDAIIKERGDEDGLCEVLNLFEMKMNLERTETTVNSATPERVTDNETETGASETNANHQVCRAGPDSQPHLMETEQSTPTPSPDESKRRTHPRNRTTAAEAGPGQLDLGPPYPTKGHITLNGKKIRWHLMEALPSLTSPKLRHERMRVFSLDVIQTPRENLRIAVRNLFMSLHENSLEKRLGMVAVRCKNYKEIDLAELLQPSKLEKGIHPCIPRISYESTSDIELIGTPLECANMLRRTSLELSKSDSKPILASEEEINKYWSARYNLITYEKLIYGDKPIEQSKLLEIDNIKELEDRAKALIKMNVAGRIAVLHMAPHFGWRNEYLKPSLWTEIGGSGWGVWWDSSYRNRDLFGFNLTHTQILFPTLVKDANLTKKLLVEAGQFEKTRYREAIAVSPKCLLENGISCFPVVQEPGMLIYKYTGDDGTTTCDVAKLRLGMGAEVNL